ncbi:pilus assembly protein [Burkholderia sp. Bp8963]|uniref:pilus assembly protein n=1 Tax=Burkholderia sp. Bp8963 TaxID=2184547 RepID=UPI000F5AEEEE|nr:pilus assembly protein [Burkholderia sp. Bp8963]RQS72237.1 pilus assembly protein [Burkholderia sp. Bp8963]
MIAIAHRFGFDGARRNGALWPGRPAALHAARCALAFGAVLTGGIHLADVADWSGLAGSRAALAAANARAAAADRVLAAATQTRDPQATPDGGDREPASPGWAALLLELAELATSSGLRIVSFEPGPPPEQRGRTDERRTVRIVADGGFPALRWLVDRLAALPVLAVPSAMRVERDTRAARVELAIDLFPGLPGAVASDGDAWLGPGSTEADPFASEDHLEPGEAAPSRLAGVMRDARAGLALFDDGTGAITAAAAGEVVGAMRVTRIDAESVMLATAHGPHRMELNGGGGQW